MPPGVTSLSDTCYHFLPQVSRSFTVHGTLSGEKKNTQKKSKRRPIVPRRDSSLSFIISCPRYQGASQSLSHYQVQKKAKNTPKKNNSPLPLLAYQRLAIISCPRHQAPTWTVQTLFQEIAKAVTR